MKLSEIISRKLICISEAKELGVVLNATVDPKMRRVISLVTADEEEEDGYIPTRYAHYGKDVVFTLTKGLDYSKEGISIPLRKEVYDTDGNLLGMLADVEFERSKITSLLLDNETVLEPSSIVNVGKKMTVVAGKRKVRAKIKAEPKADVLSSFNEMEQEDIAAETVDSPEESAATSLYEALPHVEEKTGETPSKIIYGYGFLLGRKVTKAVMKNGKCIIPKDSTIDEDAVEKAGKEGKLVELTVNSI